MDQVASARAAVKNAQALASVRRGMIRYVVLIVDCSQAMELHTDPGYQPDRWSVVVAKVTDFVKEFLKQNPLSYVQLVSMQNCKAVRLTDFSGIETAHCYALAALKPSGEASLQVALAEACKSLRLAPSYSTREILVVHSSITTCDPSDIFATLAVAQNLNIRCSVASISCEVYIFRHVAEATNGEFNVCQDSAHFIETMRKYITPLETLDDGRSHNAAFVQMGFPTQKIDAHPSLCITTQTFEREGYDCPRCKTKVHQLPVRCPVCSLALVLSSHLARSYHHLSPLQDFEHPTQAVPPEQLCFACKQPMTAAQKLAAAQQAMAESQKQKVAAGGELSITEADLEFDTELSTNEHFYECPLCFHLFCGECNDFIHYSLHNCPGCGQQANTT